MRDALDAAWGDFPTHDIGYDWLRYTGPARPTRQWCDAVVKHSRLTMIYETTSTWSQQGFDAARNACIEHERRAREVHPGCESMAVAVSDGNYADKWDASECGRGWASAATMAFFPYGTPFICESFIRGAGKSPHNLGVTWVPETWGHGTGLQQVVGYSPVANTDLNRVIAPYWSGAAAPEPPSTPTSEEDSNVISVQYKKGVDSHLWVTPEGQLAFRQYDNGAPGKVILVPGRNEKGDKVEYKITDPKPLVEQTAYGPFVVYGIGQQEGLVSPTVYGPALNVY